MCIKKTFPAIFAVAILSSTAFLSCSKGTSPGETPGQAVVQCYLVPGQPVQVKITQEIPYGSTDTLIPIPNLSVFVIGNGVSHSLSYAGNAIYSSSAITIDTGITYKLQFEYKGLEVSSSTTIPSRPANFQGSATTITVPVFGGTMPDSNSLKPVTYTWDNPSSNYNLLVLKCIEPNPVAISSSGALVFSASFHTDPSQGSKQDVSIGNFSYYGLHQVVLYRIWADYAALYKSNGTNSTDLRTPPGNITNGYGIFTGINTAADTLYITLR